MSTESQLREKLRKIEAVFAGAGTAGERLAAEAALERVRERLAELGQQDPSIEMRFLMPDQWSRHLFLALSQRYGMKPYRYYRQRRNTVMVRAPKRFLDQVLWPELSELDQALRAYLHQVTLRVIREEVYCRFIDTAARCGQKIAYDRPVVARLCVGSADPRPPLPHPDRRRMMRPDLVRDHD